MLLNLNVVAFICRVADEACQKSFPVIPQVPFRSNSVQIGRLDNKIERTFSSRSSCWCVAVQCEVGLTCVREVVVNIAWSYRLDNKKSPSEHGPPKSYFCVHQIFAFNINWTQPTFVHLACCYTYRVQMCVTYSRKCSSWQQVLSYQYQYQRFKYQYKYQYLGCKYKYKYQYPKIVLKYRSSTSTQYNKTAIHDL